MVRVVGTGNATVADPLAPPRPSPQPLHFVRPRRPVRPRLHPRPPAHPVLHKPAPPARRAGAPAAGAGHGSRLVRLLARPRLLRLRRRPRAHRGPGRLDGAQGLDVWRAVLRAVCPPLVLHPPPALLGRRPGRAPSPARRVLRAQPARHGVFAAGVAALVGPGVRDGGRRRVRVRAPLPLRRGSRPPPPSVPGVRRCVAGRGGGGGGRRRAGVGPCRAPARAAEEGRGSGRACRPSFCLVVRRGRRTAAAPVWRRRGGAGAAPPTPPPRAPARLRPRDRPLPPPHPARPLVGRRGRRQGGAAGAGGVGESGARCRRRRAVGGRRDVRLPRPRCAPSAASIPADPSAARPVRRRAGGVPAGERGWRRDPLCGAARVGHGRGV